MLGRSKNLIITIIDFFYLPFMHKWIPLKTFRYAACGGGNALFNLVVYALSYNFIFLNEVIHIGSFAMTRYIAAFVFALCFSFPLGFLLNKYVVFSASNMKGRIQLFRYGMVTGLSILGNYLLLHFFAGYCGFWATPSQALTTTILSITSYFAQTYFSFKTEKPSKALD
ncbi:MAG TPA: GtrA family protein [Edaphocola sp.]|nr:GtrA family protein [Edaphocola sp.]